MQVIDCHYRSNDPVAKSLSNLVARSFVLDGKRYASMEGFLQSLKTPLVDEQDRLAGLWGFQAFKAGQAFNSWKNDQLLHWNEWTYERSGPEYQELLDAAYDTQFDQNPALAEILKQTVGRAIRHRMGKNDTRDSVLTEAEYVSRLERLRWRALTGEGPR